MKYEVILNDDTERFLIWYLKVRPLRPEHTKNDYPNLVVNNFINGMRTRFLKEGLYVENSSKETIEMPLGG